MGAWAGVFKGRVWLMVPRPAVRGCSGEGMEVGTPPITGRCTAEELAGPEGGARLGATCRPPTSAPALLVCSPCPRYAADQLTWLIIQSTSGMGGLDAMDLQDKLNACGKLQHRPSCTGAAHSLPPAFGQREERSGVSLGPPGCALRAVLCVCSSPRKTTLAAAAACLRPGCLCGLQPALPSPQSTPALCRPRRRLQCGAAAG